MQETYQFIWVEGREIRIGGYHLSGKIDRQKVARELVPCPD